MPYLRVASHASACCTWSRGRCYEIRRCRRGGTAVQETAANPRLASGGQPRLLCLFWHPPDDDRVWVAGRQLPAYNTPEWPANMHILSAKGHCRAVPCEVAEQWSQISHISTQGRPRFHIRQALRPEILKLQLAPTLFTRLLLCQVRPTDWQAVQARVCCRSGDPVPASLYSASLRL